MTKFSELAQRFLLPHRSLSICICRNWRDLEDFKPQLHGRIRLLRDEHLLNENHFVALINVFSKDSSKSAADWIKSSSYDLLNDLVAHCRSDYPNAKVRFFCLNVFSDLSEEEICIEGGEEMLDLCVWAEFLGAGTVIQRMDIEI